MAMFIRFLTHLWYAFCTDYVLTVSRALININEDRSRRGDFVISESGYRFGDVHFTLRPLTYADYQTITGNDLDVLFPRRPGAASGGANNAQYSIQF